MSDKNPKYYKNVVYCGKKVLLFCDGICEKAWGRNSRPRKEDDSAVPDDELGVAPLDPGTIECRDCKPLPDEEKLNKWCMRECERSDFIDIGDGDLSPAGAYVTPKQARTFYEQNMSEVVDE